MNCIFKSQNLKLVLNNVPVYKLLYQQDRPITMGRVSVLKEMKSRGKSFDLAPHKLRRRSEWLDWNYDSEIYAFNKRLQENFNELTLKKAFTHKSYTENLLEKSTESKLLDQLKIEYNGNLIESGKKICNNFIQQYLRYFLRNVPEEGINSVKNYLLSTPVMAEMARLIGCTDLVLSNDFPVEKETLACTMLALIGALEHDTSIENVHRFIIDFVLTHLQPIDILDIWNIEHPEQTLDGILTYNNLQKCEFRILRQTGINTIIPCYVIGAYTNKQFIGSGAGRKIKDAKELAAYDCLRRFFELTPAKSIFKYGHYAYDLDFKSFNVENQSITNFNLNEDKKKQLSVKL